MFESPGKLSFFVLGDDTQVGMALCQYLAQRDIPFQSVPSAIAEQTDQLAERLQRIDESYVFNGVFEEPATSSATDAEAWIAANEIIASACERAGKVLMQISSAQVFSGKQTRAYLESDEPEPTSVLGKAYLELEQRAMALCHKTIILRTSWLFSGYIDNFLTRLVGAAISQESLQVSGKLRGNPTDAQVVARVLVAMAEQVDCGAEPDLWGIYHYADSDACTMHTFAKTVITVVKSMTEVRVESIDEGDSPKMVDSISQTENRELSCKKILSTFGIKQRPWRRGVHDVLKNKFSSNI